MRSLGLIFATLFLANVAVATPTYRYQDYWKKSEITVPEATMSLYIKDSPIPALKAIANATVSHNNKLPLEKVVTQLKSAVGKRPWTKDKIDGLTIYETIDAKSGNLLRIATNSATNEYSFAVVKLRYLLPSYVELHLLQVEALTGRKSPKASAMLFEVFLPRAFAADFRGAASNAASDFRAAGSGFASDIKGAGSDAAANIRGALKSAQGYVVDTGQQILAPTNATVTGAANTVSGGIKDAANDVSHTVKDVASSKNVAKLAAVGAVTGVVVSQITSFAVAGAWDLAKAAYYEAVGEYSPRERQARVESFEAALNTFKELAPLAEELDKKLDVLTANMDKVSNQVTEATLAQLQGDGARKDLKAGPANACADESKVKLLCTQISDVQDHVNPKPVNCRELTNIATEWEEAERRLLIARQSIIQNARVYIGFLNQVPEIDGFQENRKQNNACMADNEKKLRQISADAARLGCDRGENGEHSICIDYRSYQRNIKTCQMVSQLENGPGGKAGLRDSSSRLSEQVADLSLTLSQLDCEQRDGNACAKPGVLSKVQMEMQAKIGLLKNKCPGSGYLAKLDERSERAAVEKIALAKAAPANPSSSSGSGILGWFGNLWNRMFSSSSPKSAGQQAQGEALAATNAGG